MRDEVSALVHEADAEAGPDGSGERVLRRAGATWERKHERGGGGEQGEGQATRHERFHPFERGFRSPYAVGAEAVCGAARTAAPQSP